MSVPAPRQHAVTCLSPGGLHRMAYLEWGEPDNDRVLLCVHGLTRAGRDFERLAQRLCRDYRVVCPDVAGRGASDWLPLAASYGVPQYVADMVTLLARLQARELHWVGTSMGGLIGMTLAGMPGTPVRKLLLNDVGPRLEPAGLARIAAYVGRAPDFADFEEGLAYVRRVSASFGPHSDEDWRAQASYVLRPPEHAGGRWRMHYDPAIGQAFQAVAPEAAAAAGRALWDCFERIACPTLLVRGADSDLLSRETAREMAARNPRVRVVDVPGVGHAPTFMDASQIELAASFLLQADA